MYNNYIYCHLPFNPHKGGVVGYLSNLYLSFLSSSHDGKRGINHKFIFPFVPPKRIYLEDFTNSAFRYLDDYENKSGSQSLIKERKKSFKESLPNEISSLIDFNNMSSIHIHGSYNFFPVYNKLKVLGLENNVIKVLTTHNPFKPALDDLEINTRTKKWTEGDQSTAKYFFSERDYWAYKLADAYIFPCEESVEGYYNSWKDFKSIIKKDRIFYCTTGSRTKKPLTSRSILRVSLGIPDNALLIVYIGRFVKVRGYDLLLSFASRYLNLNPNAYVLIVGEYPSGDYPHSERLLFVPFTKEVGSFIAAADVCIAPHRGSYFDLGMIEILAIGTPIVASYIGGFKYLKGRTRGVIYFEPENVDSMIDAVNKFAALDAKSIKRMQKDNKTLYERELSLKQFFDNYSEAFRQIYETVPLKPKSVIVPFQSYDVFFSDPANLEVTSKKQPPKPQPPTSNKKNDKQIVSLSMPEKGPLVLTERERKLRKLRNKPLLYFKDFFVKKLRRLGVR